MNENKLKRLHNHYINDHKDKRSTFTEAITQQLRELETEKEKSDFLVKSMPYIRKYNDIRNNVSLSTSELCTASVSVNESNSDDSYYNDTDCNEKTIPLWLQFEVDNDIHNEMENDISVSITTPQQNNNSKTCDLENQSSIVNRDISTFVNSHGIIRTGKVYKEFMEDCLNIIYDNDQIQDYTDIHECKECSGRMTYIVSESSNVCERCGNSVFYQDFSSSAFHINNNNSGEIISQFAYKRVNHFREWLSQTQARENTRIPENVLIVIMKELKKERITDPKKITRDRIKRYLKKNGMSKYYEHVPIIINNVCNRDTIQLSNEMEQLLIEKFQMIQEPFERHRPKGRKNFLSYSFVLHKLCQLMDREDLLFMFPLLKSRWKLHVQDTIWSAICKDLGWKFIQSI